MVDVLNSPAVNGAIEHYEMIDQVVDAVVPHLLETKGWYEMDETEREASLRYLVGQANSEESLRQSLSELGVYDYMLSWSDVDPNNKTSLEAQALVKALGGLVAKNGALVNIHFWDFDLD
ncbi:MAG: hypothetical protein KC877_02135 [Candidatus Kaiserbacteria bacterium]|nr:hypothetical protein [Candidatus Kaiserbacteria bacterium]MCB9816165.1 hypothetical protein [Candidatus Nomurabacteria bacterium]